MSLYLNTMALHPVTRIGASPNINTQQLANEISTQLLYPPSQGTQVNIPNGADKIGRLFNTLGYQNAIEIFALLQFQVIQHQPKKDRNDCFVVSPLIAFAIQATQGRQNFFDHDDLCGVPAIKQAYPQLTALLSSNMQKRTRDNILKETLDILKKKTTVGLGLENLLQLVFMTKYPIT